MALSDVVNESPSRTTPAAGRAGRAMAVLGGVRRTIVLLILAAVVLSLNLVAGNGSAQDRTASFSEVAQTDTRAAAVELARLARDGALASSGALAAELSSQADILTDQSLLLARPGSLRGGTPPVDIPASGSDAEPAAAYVQALAATARNTLDAALRADGGTARLLASTGAAQQVLAARAAAAAGLTAPDPWEPVASAGTGTRCADESMVSGAGFFRASESAAAAEGTLPDAAAALQGALDAEYGAAYAYEVVMARTPSAAVRTALAHAREEHLAAGDRGVQLLPETCLPALTRAPAYSLPPSFTDNPDEALANLEESFPAVYADLVALGSGSVRAWAVERLAELSADLYTGKRPVPATPGLAADPDQPRMFSTQTS